MVSSYSGICYENMNQVKKPPYKGGYYLSSLVSNTFIFIGIISSAYTNSKNKKPPRISTPKWLIYMVGPPRLELGTNGL